MDGPTTSGMRGPKRSTSCPAQPESANMMKMNGNSAAPATVAE